MLAVDRIEQLQAVDAGMRRSVITADDGDGERRERGLAAVARTR
jgi:hypothetical protein